MAGLAAVRPKIPVTIGRLPSTFRGLHRSGTGRSPSAGESSGRGWGSGSQSFAIARKHFIR
ncbi:MAG: hypothetical protein ACYC2Y_07335 [Armatimonadota bacterium]